LSLAYTATDTASTAKLYYVFNRGTADGYVIVSGDDRAKPILGYTDSGTFKFENLPENLRWWLSEYARQIKYLNDNPSLAAASSSSSTPLTATTTYTAVSPLLGSIIWDQGTPYNNNCPSGRIYSNYSYTTAHYYTGCEATAVAQIMRYYKWPVKGTGSHSYSFTDYNKKKWTLSSTFSDHTYDWDNMLESYSGSYTTQQASAVALLMSDVGISLDMDYNEDGYGSSGAYGPAAPAALVNYFGYDSTADIISRDYYTHDWDAALRNELYNGRPIMYTGVYVVNGQSEGGHAFVCDGLNSSGYFHINWGWSGADNGYYQSTALNPGDSQGSGSSSGYQFNYYQTATIGIQKPTGKSYPKPYHLVADTYAVNSDGWSSTVSADIGSSVTIKHVVYNAGYTTASVASTALLLYNSSSELVSSQVISSTTESLPYYYVYSDTLTDYTVPSVAAGTYRLYFGYKITGDKDWRKVDVATDYSQYILVTITSSKGTFSSGSTGDTPGTPSVALVNVSGKSFTDIAGNQKVEITGSTGENYFYTTDGSEPTTSSSKYSAPFVIKSTDVVKAKAFSYGDPSLSAAAKFTATPTLADLLTYGTTGAEYTISNALANKAQVYDPVAGKYYIYATDGNGNWIKVQTDKSYAQSASSVTTISGVTLDGTFNKATNPLLSLVSGVSAASSSDSEVDVELNTYDLQKSSYAPKNDEVVYVIGYYDKTSGKIYEYYGDPESSSHYMGASVVADWTYLPDNTFTALAKTKFKVANESSTAASAVKGIEKAASKSSYIAYVVVEPTSDEIYTAVNNVESQSVNIVAAKGLIAVTGADNVRIYNTAGALVSTAHEAYVTSGVYMVVADGHTKKVFVR
jgi:hypothetical protein